MFSDQNGRCFHYLFKGSLNQARVGNLFIGETRLVTTTYPVAQAALFDAVLTSNRCLVVKHEVNVLQLGLPYGLCERNCKSWPPFSQEQLVANSREAYMVTNNVCTGVRA